MGAFSSGRQWTPDEETVLLEFARRGDVNGAAAALNRTPCACQARAYLLGSSPSPSGMSVWTEAEDRRLVELISTGMSVSKASEQMNGRTAKACSGRLCKLVERHGGSRHELYAAYGIIAKPRKEKSGRAMKKGADASLRRPWTAGEDDRLLQMADEGASAKAIAEALRRLPESVLARLAVLDGMAEMGAAETAAKTAEVQAPRYPDWTDEETAELERLFADGEPASEIALAMGREQADVRSRIDTLGLCRSAARRRQSRAGETFRDFEDRAIRDSFAFVGAEALGRRLGRPAEEIAERALVVCGTKDPYGHGPVPKRFGRRQVHAAEPAECECSGYEGLTGIDLFRAVAGV